MNYYKIILNDSIIGVGNCFLKYQKVNNLSLETNKKQCQYVAYNGKLYHDSWMSVPPKNLEIIQAEVVEIENDEYEILLSSLRKNEEIKIEVEEELEQEENNNFVDFDNTLDFIKQSKINEFKSEANKKIIAGVDFEGKHYSYTTQDQLNLITLIQNKDIDQLYHADGEAFEYYSYDKLFRLNSKLLIWKNLNVIYYNDARQYIETLTDISEISNLQYGFELPKEFQSEVYKSVKEMYKNV